MIDAMITYGDRQTFSGLLDNDTSPTNSALTVSRVDSSGLAGVADVTVLDDGRVVVKPYADSLASGQSITKQIVYTVMDENGNADMATATIVIQGGNDAPVINGAVGSLTLTSIVEDSITTGNTVASLIVSGGGTLISDVDDGAVQGIAVTGADQTNGDWQYSLNGTGWQSLAGVSDTNATLLDTSSRIRFVPTTNFAGAAGGLTFRAWDQSMGSNGQSGVDVSANGGSSAWSAITVAATIQVTSSNDTPSITTNTGANASEGGAIVLTSSSLKTSDSDNTDDELVYSVTGSPENGQLESVSAAGTPITTFTQTDINNGSIRYVHNGSETTSDHFTFTVSDGVQSVTGSFSLTVTPQNDVPTITTNTGMTVAESGRSVITNTNLAVGDPDNTPDQLRYTMTTVSAHGHFERVSESGTAITSFTQAELNSLAIRYVHDGSETTADSLSFSTSDGSAALTGTFSITITPVNDVPVIAEHSLALQEGQTVTLAPANVSASDVESSVLVYTVSDVSNGAFFNIAVNDVVTTFTTEDVSAGVITFIHDGSENVPMANVSASDGEYSSPVVAMSFDVTPVNDLPTICVNTVVTVTEGESQPITSDQLSASDPDNTNSELVYTVTGMTQYGVLELIGAPGVSVTSFTQDDIVNGRVRFVHNGSESVSDSFGFSLSDGTVGGEVTGTFSITIQPADDTPVLIVQTITVEEGGTVVLSGSDLSVNDPDSYQFVLTVLGMTHGRFVNLETGTEITSFTPGDVVDGLVAFIHDGGETLPTAALSVADATSSSTAVAIDFSLTHVNDVPVLEPATFLVPENSNNGTLVGQVTVIDPDQGDTWTFSLLNGPANAYFSLDSATGEIRVTDGRHLNYELQSAYELQVEVVDSSGAVAQ